MAKASVNMCEGPFLKKILLYTIPIMLTGLLQLTFNAADLIIVGQFCGSVSVASVGATGALTNLIVNLFMGLSVGSGVTVAQALGAGHEKEVHRIIHTAIPAAIFSGLFLTVVGVCFSGTFLQWMGTPDDVMPLSSLYMKIYFGGILGPIVYNFGASILRACGDTKSPLIFLTLAGVINVLLNTIFVTVFHWDVAGVALATILSQFFAATMVLLALSKRTDACKLELKKLKIYKAPLLKIIRIGVPSGIQGAMFSISNVILQSSVNAFGSVFMSGHAASANLEGFLYTTINSFHQSALNFTGQNVGARRYDNVKRVVTVCVSCAVIVGSVLGLLMWLFSKPLLSIYITDSAEAIYYGSLRMACVVIPYFTIGIMDVMSGVLRGMGASLSPMLISIIGVCGFRMGWIFSFYPMFADSPVALRAVMLYLIYPASWIITATAEFIAFRILLKRQQKSLSRRIAAME
ncbi:MAG: MATE family efflux transporter [Clostridia bacterium]|nr:MATE family efflux transporter [Clostridia bacterium]